MKLGNTLSFNRKEEVDKQLETIRLSISKLYDLVHGRVRMGTGTSGDRGENLDGYFKQFTSHASIDTEFTVAHGCGITPVGYQILWQDKAGSLYQGPSTGTAWTSTNAYLKCSASSVTFLVFFYR